MGNIFRYDNKFFEALEKITDIIILNLLFIFCCIPIITIGASITSMYSVTMGMVKNEENYVIKSFIKKFKDDFIVSTKVWILMIIVGGVLVFDFQIINQLNNEILSKVLPVIFTMVSIILIFVFSYIFPIISKFDNNIKNTLINSILISIQNLPYTILIVLINILPIVLLYFISSFFGYVLFFYVVIGFGVSSYINSTIFNKILDKYAKADFKC